MDNKIEFVGVARDTVCFVFGRAPLFALYGREDHKFRRERIDGCMDGLIYNPSRTDRGQETFGHFNDLRTSSNNLV